MPLRVSAISFLNPAPLLYNFEHEPTATELRTRYDVHYTTPAHCARELHAGAADLGLIPIAELAPNLAIVPGCAIASLHDVRSILLLVKNPRDLTTDDALTYVRTIAVDSASRSSTAYAHILFEHFHNTRPTFIEHPADPLAMLSLADAALLIGDPALLAREQRSQIDETADHSLLWLDLASLWRERTGLPWVAAVWAVCTQALPASGVSSQQLTADLIASRDAGRANIPALVREWTPRLPLPPATIHTYLTRNIHYTLDPDCLRTIQLFRSLAAQFEILPPLPSLDLLS